MHWPTSRQAGRYTISPDNVGQRVGPEQDFETVVLIHDGKDVLENLDKSFIKLMKESKL